ncbi:trans-aconitate 2-methyltransferase [Egicoccus sp. AB-alg2]|uniref:class I SAM-dependent methyltransferase n=1 Tax=Egicoccus sp. AB-alg2 TaxID=3242693 RepID=UPI00359CF67E
MSTSITTPVSVDERLLADAVAAMELASVSLGLELGLYRALHEQGPATAEELADRADVAPRYAREWLEQQTAAGWLRCPNPDEAAEVRRFSLPAVAAAVLLEPDSGIHLGPLVHIVRASVGVFDRLLPAYRTGTGIPYADYGTGVRQGLAALNGPTFDTQLAAWIAALPDVDRRLREGAAPRVLDLGCGVGRSTLALARAYPRAVVHGIDLDAASVREAEAAASAAGLAHRVTFRVADAAELASEGRYDLVTVLEALHDMGDPVGALRAVRPLLAEHGVVYVADERVADTFGEDADLVERLTYGFSILHCLPATLAEDPVVANGTALRATTLRAWARQAGYRDAVDLGVDDPFWRHYRLDPEPVA